MEERANGAQRAGRTDEQEQEVPEGAAGEGRLRGDRGILQRQFEVIQLFEFIQIKL